MREIMTVAKSDMAEWEQICRVFAKKQGAKLLFVNESSMGLEYPDGTMKHVYIDELEAFLKRS